MGGVGGGESKQIVIVRNVVNIAMAGINLSAVILVLIMWLYLSVTFSGFPYRSQNSRDSLRKVSRLLLVWSVGRIIWGFAMLFVYMHDVDLLRPAGSGWSPLILFLLLVLCEITPIIVLMDYSFMTIFDFADSALREMSSLATGQHVLASDARSGSQKSDHGGDEEVPVLGNGSLSESTEPLLGQNAL